MNASASSTRPGELMVAARGTAASLGLALVVWALLFQAEVVSAVQTWYVSTAYNHCFLVIPIVAYLLWDRRADLQGLSSKPVPLAGLLALPVIPVWLLAERLGIMEGRQLAAITFAEILLLAVLGWRLWWAASGPLLYLYFLVPFGEFLVPRLQDLTAIFIQHGIVLTGIPAYIDGYTIEIAAGTFYVAEACAGLRFLIASIAFGGLYSLMIYRSPARRAVFMLASIVVPVIANGFRALGIVVLGHILGSSQAAAADHVIYGWVFFSLVILMLVALGLPFRQDDIRAPVANKPLWPDLRAAGAIGGLTAAGLLLGLTAIGPGIAFGLNRAVVTPMADIAPLDPGLGCTTVASTQIPSSTGSAAMMMQRVACGPSEFDIKVAIFSPRSTAAAIMAERRRLSRAIEAEDVSESWLFAGDRGEAAEWRLIRSNKPAFVLAVAVWIDGQPTRPGMNMRGRMAVTSMTGGDYAPIVVSVAPAEDWSKLTLEEQRRGDQALPEFLLSHPGIGTQIEQLAKRLP